MTPEDRVPPPPSKLPRVLALLALALAVAAALTVASGGPGTRFGWWHFRTGFQMMQHGAKIALAAIVLALVALLVGMVRRPRAGAWIAAVALVLAAAAFFLPWNWRRGARQYPPIHDITTDFRDPPALVYSRALRDSLDINPWEYEGDSIAAQQRRAYPDIRPVLLAMPLDSAYAAAYRAAEEMGWEITDASREQRRIEAADRTAWFGFVDDVVIRVSPGSGISRVDIRSVSRVGRGDVGANAARIRKYVAKLEELYPDAIAETS